MPSRFDVDLMKAGGGVLTRASMSARRVTADVPLVWRRSLAGRTSGSRVALDDIDGRGKSIVVLCQNCVTYPPKPWGNTMIYAHTAMHIDVAGSC